MREGVSGTAAPVRDATLSRDASLTQPAPEALQDTGLAGPATTALITAPVRLDRRTKRLVGRLRPGDAAIIDHVDLDRVAAESLVAARVAAVLNAKPSISGRYPNLGPELLIAAGIPLIDDLGDAIFDMVVDGEVLVIDANAVRRGDTVVARGVRQDAGTVANAMAEAREGLFVQLELFAANTMEYLKRERELLLDGVGMPADPDQTEAAALPHRGPRL